MKWEPIETAPIDQYVLIAFYWKKGKTFYEPGATWDVGCGTYDGERYIDQLHLDLEDFDAVWMPLPEPPKEKEENQNLRELMRVCKGEIPDEIPGTEIYGVPVMCDGERIFPRLGDDVVLYAALRGPTE